MQVRRIPCAATISEHRPGANRPTTVYIILRSLSLEPQQKIFSFKLLCCHHSDQLISRTLDLRSLLLSEYCSRETPFTRGSTSCPPSAITRTRTHTNAYTVKKSHATLTYMLVQLCKCHAHVSEVRIGRGRDLRGV